jgi:hypothetical protein
MDETTLDEPYEAPTVTDLETEDGPSSICAGPGQPSLT